MARAAIELGAVDRVLPLEDIPRALLELVAMIAVEPGDLVALAAVLKERVGLHVRAGRPARCGSRSPRGWRSWRARRRTRPGT